MSHNTCCVERGSHVDERDIRFKLAAARRMLYREGCDSGSAGHVSARDPGDDFFWTSPMEYFDETLPANLVKLDLQMNPIDGDRDAASPAVSFHAAVYRKRPDVNAIVHHHGHFTTVLSSTERMVEPWSTTASLFLGRQSLYREDLGVSPALEDERIADSLGDKAVLLIKNHGCVVAAESMEATAVLAFTLEACARLHLDSLAAGGTPMGAHEGNWLKEQMTRYFLPETWKAQLRRLRRSDPDLFESVVAPVLVPA